MRQATTIKSLRKMKSTLQLVTTALAGTEEMLRKEYDKQLTAQCDLMLAELAEDGWDAHKRFGYPYGAMSRLAYFEQQRRYNLCSKYTHFTGNGSRGMHDPDMRAANADNAEVIAKAAAKMAKDALEGFCHKLTGKIEKTIDMHEDVHSVRYEGGLDPWGWSYIHVDVRSSLDKRKQIWQTKMIINVSCKGKLFNQWPTRQVVG